MFPILNSPFAPLDLQESMRFCRSSLPPHQRELPHYLFVCFAWPLMSTFPERSNDAIALFHCLHPSCQSSDLKCFQSVFLSRNLAALFVLFSRLSFVLYSYSTALSFLSTFHSIYEKRKIIYNTCTRQAALKVSRVIFFSFQPVVVQRAAVSLSWMHLNQNHDLEIPIASWANNIVT